jgi:hypothetical protein
MPFRRSATVRSTLLFLPLAILLLAADATAQNDGTCTQTAHAAWTACGNEADDDFWKGVGRCMNTAESGERQSCLDETGPAREDARQECDSQLQARLDLCRLLGEAPYDPEFERTDFVDPLEIGGSVSPNPYFPLVPGSHWVYQGGDETNTVVVVGKVQEILGVPCTVVRDIVQKNGDLVEETFDWFAQQTDGTVWYCGELSLEFEKGALLGMEGTWKAGRDLARPGIIMPGDPQVGQAVRQEFALGDAEDAAQFLTLTGSVSTPAAACTGECAVTVDFSPLEPGVFELKFYKPGVGRLSETDLHGGGLQLVEFEIPTP